ncbi:MAG: hypothetical protein H0W06_12190 [Chloroflexia bacterium]|nr:hypothetical protein [Chloroflexia bacterium]
MFDVFQQEGLPDFIVFYDDLRDGRHIWLIVEIKGRLRSGASPLQQLERGASAIEHHPLFRLSRPHARFLIPLVLFDGKSRAADFARYDRKRIRFFGENYQSLTKRCRPGIKFQDLDPKNI